MEDYHLQWRGLRALARVARMGYGPGSADCSPSPGLIEGFIAGTRLDLAPFCISAIKDRLVLVALGVSATC